jgi:glycosyltransferase involved in cell wall biosynthesis
MLKLLQVIGSMDPQGGGVCQGVRNLSARAMEEGSASVEVVCLDDPQADFLSRDRLCIHALGKGKTSWYYQPALRPWLDINLPRFDAVILNGLWQCQGYTLWRATRRPDAPPYFMFPHGMLDPWFQRAGGRRMKALRNWLYWKAVEQHIVADAAALLFTCQEELRLARETFRPYQPKEQVSVGFGAVTPPPYENGMEEAFLRACPGAKGQPYFLFLGRIHPKKGVHFLIEAYAALCRSAGSTPPPILVVAGPDAEGPYGRKMQELAAQLCPSNSVCWPGMLTGAAKWGAFYNCEASVLPSNQENFGIAVVETLACGRPVLVSDQVNIWREIQEDGAGFAQKNTVEGTTRLLADWMKLSPAAQAKMAAAAKPCFQQRFSIESVNHNLMQVIQSKISRGKLETVS